MLEADNLIQRTTAETQAGGWHHLRYQNHEKGNTSMTKTLEMINEAVRNPKYAFRKVINQPKKPLKHRYERRKIKEYLHLGDWLEEEMA
jgi:hypothetical protein